MALDIVCGCSYIYKFKKLSCSFPREIIPKIITPGLNPIPFICRTFIVLTSDLYPFNHRLSPPIHISISLSPS